MSIYTLRRHVVYVPGCQQTQEVWGIDRTPAALPTGCAPRDTDADDPLRDEECGSPRLLRLGDGSWVTWRRIGEWLSLAEAAGYEVVSGYQKLSPYSAIILRGP